MPAGGLTGFPAQVMSLATASCDGEPDVRLVVLLAIVGEGLVFFTDLNSANWKQLRANSRIAACFHWPGLGGQVRLRRSIHTVDDDHAHRYFAGRARGSKCGRTPLCNYQ